MFISRQKEESYLAGTPKPHNYYSPSKVNCVDKKNNSPNDKLRETDERHEQSTSAEPDNRIASIRRSVVIVVNPGGGGSRLPRRCHIGGDGPGGPGGGGETDESSTASAAAADPGPAPVTAPGPAPGGGIEGEAGEYNSGNDPGAFFFCLDWHACLSLVSFE